MKYKNKKEARLINQFFDDLGWLVHECDDSMEFETWTKAGVNIIITLLDMTFDELSEYLDAVSCDEEIELLRQDGRYRKQFTLKQSVDDIYGFYCGLDDAWDKFLSINTDTIMKEEIRDWLRRGNEAGRFVQRLSDIVPNPKIDFKAGDRVVFTNDYGVSFINLTIIAIGKDNDLWKYGHCIYLDKESYWFPVKPESVSIQYER